MWDHVGLNLGMDTSLALIEYSPALSICNNLILAVW